VRAGMTRFFVRPDALSGDRVIFDRQEMRHLIRVRRLRTGDVVQTVDGNGHELVVRLTHIGPRAVEGHVISRSLGSNESPIELTLVQALPKGDKLERIIRMATELGVARIVPVIGERTISRAEPAHRSERVIRWRRVAQEAAKQSGRAVIPEVRPLITLAQWLKEPRAPGLLLALWERAHTPLAQVLPDPPVEHASLVVGPEGGLSEAEVQNLESAGALIAGLGSRILRCDTAAVVGVALMQSRFGDLGRTAADP
jgi:16S rRNA (uracil1498-N3)-methyltransferase